MIPVYLLHLMQLYSLLRMVVCGSGYSKKDTKFCKQRYNDSGFPTYICSSVFLGEDINHKYSTYIYQEPRTTLSSEF